MEVAAHVVDHGSGMFSPGFTGDDAPRAVSLMIAFTQHGEVCTVDASTAQQFFPWKCGHYFHEPLFILQSFSSRQTPQVGFFEPSSTHTCECSRARGGGVAGSLTPR